MAKAKKAVPEGHHTVTPQLTLDNAARTIDWYKKALGAEEVARAVGPDGKILHAEVRVGDSLIMRDSLQNRRPAGRLTLRLRQRCAFGQSGSFRPRGRRYGFAPRRPSPMQG